VPQLQRPAGLVGGILLAAAGTARCHDFCARRCWT
jgi:hypothetical protein